MTTMTNKAHLDAICHHLCLQSSTERLGQLINYLSCAESTRDFWHLFYQFWSVCDQGWHWQDELKWELWLHGPGRRYFKKEQREFFRSLPETVVVYRGCSASRVLGVSWTTNQKIAADFARGHRFLHTPDPVIATAEIPKSWIYTVCLDRDESEVLWIPDEVPIDDPSFIEVEAFNSPGFK
jgi:hypothetical protein